MPASPHPHRPIPLATRAKLTAAATASTPPHLTAFTTSLPPAACSNAPQPAPPTVAPAQNEPTSLLPPDIWQEVLREFNAIKSAAESHPANLLQPAPIRSNAHPEARRRKTNPDRHPSSPHLPTPSSPRRPRPLTPTQLRAARLWFDGHPTAAILQTLAISRHTLARWKRHPDFQAELRRLVDLQSRQNSTVA